MQNSKQMDLEEEVEKIRAEKAASEIRYCLKGLKTCQHKNCRERKQAALNIKRRTK